MAVDILGRKRPQDVLVYGAGRSLDNLHIQRLPGVGVVSIGDIMKLRDDAPFVDANQPGDQTFPIVVASEVVEHFRDPWTDFQTLIVWSDRADCSSAGPTSTAVGPSCDVTATPSTPTTRRTTRSAR